MNPERDYEAEERAAEAEQDRQEHERQAALEEEAFCGDCGSSVSGDEPCHSCYQADMMHDMAMEGDA